MAYAGGGTLALGAIWLMIEAMLRYSVKGGVPIVTWRGKWPTDCEGRTAIHDRIAATQDRELRFMKRARPFAIAICVIGVVLIIVASTR